MQIRTATPSDADAMEQVHAAAVHGLAASHYDADLLVAWSPPDAPHRALRAALAGRLDVMLVAEDEDGIAGFAAFRPATWEVHAVYVHPRAARRGVGSRLLAALEAHARARHIGHLRLDASLNAEAFYRAHGYRGVERRRCRLGGGHALPAVRMIKRLDAGGGM